MGKKGNYDQWLSYIHLRQAIGALGIVLPLICIAGGFVFGSLSSVQTSISYYYHTNMRDFLVGLLGCVALFLVSYKGYGWVDNLVTWVIGIAGAGIALFPCPTHDGSIARLGMFQIPAATCGLLHLVFTTLFFLLLAVNSIFLFTLNRDKPATKRKRWRNIVYIVCGIFIFASMAALFVFFLVAPDFIETTSIGLVFETIMLCAFGISWLVKGDTFKFLKDKEGEI